MTIDRQHLAELAALAASGSATPQERAELDRMIAEDPAAAGEVRAFSDAASLLALELGEVPPPAACLADIRAAIARVGRSEAPPPPIIALADRKKIRTLAIATAVSLAAAAAFAFLWLRERSAATALRDEIVTERDRHDLERQELQREMADELTRARAQTQEVLAHYEIVRGEHTEVSNISSESGAMMKVFVDPDRRRWLVLALKLPPLPPDEDYQLWFVPPMGAPVSAGLLTTGPDGALTAKPDLPEGMDRAKAAISVEPKGGSSRPTKVMMMGDPI